MIKAAPYLYLSAILSILLILILPFWLVQTICFGLLFIELTAYLYVKNLQTKIKVERKISQLKVNCREQIFITFTIKNFSRLSVFLCYYFDQAPYFYIYNDKNQDIISLRPKEIRQISYKVSAQNRGLYHIGPVKIRTSDPLGLFLLENEIPAPLEITVRPARIKLQTQLFPGIPQGCLKIKNPVYEDITMRRSIREYQYGDEQKRINWRASAKYQKLFTNQFEDSYDVPVFVFLNLAKDDYELHTWSYHTEKAIEIAGNIVEKTREKKQRCGFAAYASDFPYLAPNHNQADYILDLLAVIKPEEGKLDYDVEKKYRNQLPAGTLIYIVGPEVVEKYFAKVEANKEDINTTNLGVLKTDERR